MCGNAPTLYTPQFASDPLFGILRAGVAPQATASFRACCTVSHLLAGVTLFFDPEVGTTPRGNVVCDRWPLVLFLVFAIGDTVRRDLESKQDYFLRRSLYALCPHLTRSFECEQCSWCADPRGSLALALIAYGKRWAAWRLSAVALAPLLLLLLFSDRGHFLRWRWESQPMHRCTGAGFCRSFHFSCWVACG